MEDPKPQPPPLRDVAEDGEPLDPKARQRLACWSLLAFGAFNLALFYWHALTGYELLPTVRDGAVPPPSFVVFVAGILCTGAALIWRNESKL